MSDVAKIFIEEMNDESVREVALRSLWKCEFKHKHPSIFKYLGWAMNFYDSCVGVTLFKLGRRKVEVWFCPSGYRIPKHSHDLEDIELLFICGDATFYRTKNFSSKTESRVVSGFLPSLRTFSIPSGTTHWFEVSTRTLVFVNFSKWKDGVKVTSASKDFNLK